MPSAQALRELTVEEAGMSLNLSPGFQPSTNAPDLSPAVVRENELAPAWQQIENLESEVARQRLEIAQQTDTIMAPEEQVARYNQMTDVLNVQLEQFREVAGRSVAELKAALEISSTEKTRLRTELEAIRRALEISSTESTGPRTELHAIRRTSSWRVSAPLHGRHGVDHWSSTGIQVQ
jgi:hypothetical protein